MPGPTTESLATDYKDLLRELTAIRSDIAKAREEARSDNARFREEFSGFRGQVEVQLKGIRWVGATMTAFIFTLVGSAVWLSWHASGLNHRVEDMEKTTSGLSQQVRSLEQATTGLTQRVDGLEKTTAKFADRLDLAVSSAKTKSTTP